MGSDEVSGLIALVNEGKWWAVSAVVVGLIVRLLKSRPSIAAALPPRVRPWLAVGLGLVAGVLNRIVEGTPWKAALIGGAVSGLTAVLGHEFVVESAMGGKEPGAKPPTLGGPSAGGPGLMAILVVTFALTVPGCALFTQKNARTALDAVQLACVFQSEITDEKALADACGIAKDLIPLLRDLVSQREAAKRSGVRWSSDGGAP